jgi:uncharacterized delta-60 repeat protein
MRRIWLISLLFCISISGVLSQAVDKTFNPVFEGPTHVANGVIVGDDELVIQGSFSSISGVHSSSIVKITKEGTLSSSFNASAFISTYSEDIAKQSDEKVLLLGYFTDSENHFRQLMRLLPDGAIDNSFQSQGIGEGEPGFVFYNLIGIQSDDKIIVAGQDGLKRLNADGSPDPSFSNLSDIWVTGMAVQDDNKILFVANNEMKRLNADGSVDDSFEAISFSGSVNSIDFQSDNRIIVGGSFAQVNDSNFKGLARINTDGTLDDTFQNPGIDLQTIQMIKVFPDDKIIAIDDFYHKVIKLEANGEVDPTFQTENNDINANSVGSLPNLYFTAIQSDGSIIIGGYFTSSKATPRLSLARIKPDGNIDESYDPRPSSSAFMIEDVQPVPANKLLVAGRFTYVNGEFAPGGIVRLNADGSTDHTFDVSSIDDWGLGYIKTIGRYADGKILLGGSFYASSNGFGLNSLIRLTEDGDIDESFSEYNGISADIYREVSDIIIQNDGKAIIAGGFEKVNDIDRKYLARLNSDGSLDLSFHSGGTDYPEPIGAMDLNSTTGKIALFRPNVYGAFSPQVKIANPDGSIDSNFDITGKLDIYTLVNSVIFLSDGKLLMAGNFTSLDGHPVNKVLKISEEGVWDQTLRAPTSSNDVHALLKTNVKKILVGRDASSDLTNAFSVINESGALMPFTLDIRGNIHKILNGEGNNFYISGDFFPVDNSFVSGGLLKINAESILVPEAPTELKAKGQEKSIKLTWNDNATVTAEFEIERSIGNNENFTLHAITETASFIDNLSLEKDVVFYYRVKARNLNGKSAYSNEASAALAVPEAPTELKAGGKERSIVLTWENNATVRAEFEIERSIGNNENFTLHAITETASFIDSLGLEKDVVFYYRVKARNLNGKSTYSNEASAALAIPEAPTELKAEGEERSIVLTWKNNATVSAEFEIERSAGNNTEFSLLAISNVANFVDSVKLEKGIVLYYRIRARNLNGKSAYSNEASAGLKIPEPPTELQAIGLDGSVALMWKNNSTVATEFEIERSAGNNTNFTLRAISDAAVFIDTISAISDTIYYYRVSAINLNGKSAYSNEAFAVLQVPEAPAELKAKGLETVIELTWKDNATIKADFEIERSAENDSNFKFLAISDRASFTDTVNVTTGTLFYYRVRAKNLNGESAFSNETSASLLLVTGIEDKSASGIGVYPNPFTESFTLQNETATKMEASILNYSGMEIFRVNVDSGNSTDLGGTLPVGMYILRVNQSAKQSSFKLIKK